MREVVVAATLAVGALTGLSGPGAAQSTPPASSPPSRGMGMMRADTDGDGVVTRAEATAQADAQFAAADTDRDGKVTADERRAAFAAGAPGGRFRGGPASDTTMTRDDFRTRALSRFDWTDANGDGRIDAAEINAMRQMRMNRGSDAAAAATSTPQQ